MENDALDWDVGFWSNRYPPAFLAIYNREIGGDATESLRGLWRWKSLHRTGLDPEEFQPYLEQAKCLRDQPEGSVCDLSLEDIADAFVTFRERLKKDGPLSENSRVIATPQFLLHLADSEDGYSGRFPILDVMVARAVRTHTATDDSRTLQGTLTGGRESYLELVGYLLENCEFAVQVAQLERALFVQGRAIAAYRENDGEFEKVRELPVSIAREYLDDIRKHTHSKDPTPRFDG